MEKYWMVHREDGNHPGPNFKHDRLMEATLEAKRLAKANPGGVFIIVEAISGYSVTAPEPQPIEFEAPAPF